jgi:hypothetical protein
MQIASIARNVGKTLHDNSPAILTGLAVTGVVSTAYLAVRGGMQAQEIIRVEDELRKNTLLEAEYVGVPLKDQLKLTWQLYIPALVIGGATVGCIIGANTISSKRQAVGIAAYSLLERGAREYKDKVVETIGHVKEEGIRSEVAKERIEKIAAEGNDVIVYGSGKLRCFESFTGRQFMSDKVTIEKAVNELNKQMLANDYASLNDLNSLLNIPRVPMGDDFGWKADRLVEVKWSATLVEDEPCLVLDYNYVPIPGYSRVW